MGEGKAHRVVCRFTRVLTRHGSKQELKICVQEVGPWGGKSIVCSGQDGPAKSHGST